MMMIGHSAGRRIRRVRGKGVKEEGQSVIANIDDDDNDDDDHDDDDDDDENDNDDR